MSLISENVIPGNHGKIFETNAKELEDLELIKNAALRVDGVEKVIIDADTYPKQFTVQTSKLVEVISIENEINKTGFHAIPKAIFPL